MTPIQFNGYGAGSRGVVIIAERVTHFFPIDYNGNHGTCIVLDTGKEVNVGNWSSEVSMALSQVQNKEEKQ